ncbi:MAG: transketolase [Solirubrobacterales bacterium]|nr:transketolase [Solirubrobacterales bacterium]
MSPPPIALEAEKPPTGAEADRSEVDRLCVDTIRTLAMDAVEAANSGHPGMPMAMAPVAYLLYGRVMRHNPRDPGWADRDRFVLSAGHGSMLLYAALHLSGYELSLDDLKRFRQWGSRTPGHPEHGLTPGVETTTGPLGQGLGNAVGMAMAERFLRERYGSDVCDHRTFGICSDGDLMEGVAAEAASLAGHLGLGRLIFLYDDNKITIDGDTALSFSEEDVSSRFEAYGWHVTSVEDANDLEALELALEQAIAEQERPSLIKVSSVLAYGAPTKAGTSGAHGSPLGEEEVRAAKVALGCDPDRRFHVPDAVYEAFDARDRGALAQREWETRVRGWRAGNPSLAAEWDRGWQGLPLPGVEEAKPSFADQVAVATRAASGKTMEMFGPYLPTMVGGAADLRGSVKTGFGAGDSFSRASAGRNVNFGVREHAMAAAVNGLALHGAVLRPFGATFLQFADYMRPAIRLSALMRLRTVWVFSHDSVGVGEDGPTHQPIEHLAALRAIPGLTVIRPGDAEETVAAWHTILALDGPACLVLSRQKLPVLDRSTLASADSLARGGYILSAQDNARPDATLVATGSEVSVALEAAELLAGSGIKARVVSMPSLELFAAQEKSYREAVLPPGVPSVSVEAGIAQGWEGLVDRSVAIERFGTSAPGPQVMARLGITPAAVVESVLELL